MAKRNFHSLITNVEIISAFLQILRRKKRRRIKKRKAFLQIRCALHIEEKNGLISHDNFMLCVVIVSVTANQVLVI